MEKTFTYLNTRIHYQIVGQGPAVFLIHGFGENSSVWDKQIAFLQPHCSLIVPDLPGSGESSLLEGLEISIEDYAEIVIQILINENIQRAIFLGHSMGGYIALAVVEKYPERIIAFGLIHSTAFADSEDKKNTRLKSIEFIKNNGSHSFLKNTIPNLFSDNFKKNNNEVLELVIDAGKSISSHSLIQYLSAMMRRPDRTHVLKQSTVPVLFIIGEQDVAAPLDDLRKQIHLPKQPYIHILENVGHMGMLEATEEVNTYMLEFITRQDAEA